MISGAFAVVREGHDHPALRVFEVTGRARGPNGQILLAPEIEAATYDTSRPDAPVLLLGLVTYNGLRLCGQDARAPGGGGYEGLLFSTLSL
ncbi:MAG TPA: hypothetical protein PK360_04300 [bacterium]|nr:hypothetical protein [bacterium]